MRSLATAVAACLLALPAQAADVRVSTKSGRLLGQASGDVVSFMGVP